MSKIRHCLTLFGFTGPFARGDMDFEACMAKAHELGYSGIELVAAQMMPSYPFSDPKWNDYFRGLCRTYDLRPVCYSAYIDKGLRSDRDLNDREMLQFTLNDLEIAHDLGFEIMRSQFALTPKVMEQALPYAESYGIHLAVEMHAPHTPSTAIWQDFLELFRRRNSPYLGVVPDFSSFVEKIPETYLDDFSPERGDKKILQQLIVDFNDMMSAEGLRAEADAMGGGEEEQAFIDELFAMAQRDKVEYEGLKEFLPYTKYIHGKYYYINDDGVCRCINHQKLLGMLKEVNYNGYICTEFEGNRFSPHIDDIEQIRRHIRLLDEIWAGENETR